MRIDAVLFAWLPSFAFCSELGVRVQRGGDAPAAVVDWYGAMDRLLDGTDSLLRRLSSSGTPSVRAALDAAGALRSLAKDFSTLASPADAASVSAAAGEIEGLCAGRPPAEPLPEEALSRVYSLGRGSAHRLALLMREKALDSFGPRSPLQANALLAFPGGLEVPALDTGRSPLVQGGAVLSPPLRALARAFSSTASAGRPFVVLGKRRAWVRLDGADVYACLGSAQSGGELRVSYREEGGSVLEEARFYLLAKTLLDEGFAVSVGNGALSAVIDGSRSRLDAEALAERFAFALRAASACGGLPPRLGDYLSGTLTQAQNAARLDAVSRILRAEGGLEGFPSDSRGFAAAVEDYLRKDGAREGLRLRLGRTLASLRLPPFPDVPLGRRTLGLHFNEPVEEARVRGELRLEAGRPSRNPSYDPLVRLARAAAPGASRAARLAPLMSGLSVLGTVGGRLAERGQWRLDAGRWIAVYTLRGPQGPEPVFAELLFARAPPSPLPLSRAFVLMEEMGLIAPESSPSALQARPAGGKAVLGRTLRPGPAVEGRVTFDRKLAEGGGRVFVTPYASAADFPALRRSKGMLTVFGGPSTALLAEAALVAALDLPQADLSRAGLLLFEPVLGPPRSVAGVEVRAASGRRVVSLREGGRVRLDAGAGSLEILR